MIITGISGSGKSSLAFDTLYAEGQKRYLESLSTYARMIVSDTSSETKVREIRGLSPTIAIHQKTVSNNPRSTVGTITEIYDYYRLLYATVGRSFCPNHPHIELKKDTIRDMLATIEGFEEGEKFYVGMPLPYDRHFESLSDIAKYVSDIGFVRFQCGKDMFSVADNFDNFDNFDTTSTTIIVDRLVVKRGEEERYQFEVRLKDSLILAFQKGNGAASLYRYLDGSRSDYFEHASCPICGYHQAELTLSHFSFNSHHGACEACHGLGTRTSFSEENIMSPTLTLAEGAILPWTSHPYYTSVVEQVCLAHKIDLHTPYGELKKSEREKILYGVPGMFDVQYTSKFEEGKSHKVRYEGVIPNLERRYKEADSGNDAYYKRIVQFATEEICPTCRGYRLKPEYLSVHIGGKNIGELASLSVRHSEEFFEHLTFTTEESQIVAPVLKNIRERLEFLSGVGLHYVTLARRANTLSGGESQRIRLATQIGTRLEGIIYVLDEPSIGLHPRDNDMLIANLKRLALIGNTVVVVEHDEDIMRESDYIIDI